MNHHVEVSFHQTRIDGPSASYYTLVRIWKATDDAGNTAIGTQNIFVEGITTPNPKFAIWNGDTLTGNVGDGRRWSDVNNWSWTDGGVHDLAPNRTAPGDNVVFQPSPTVVTIVLESRHFVISV